MKNLVLIPGLVLFTISTNLIAAVPLGLPDVPVPANNKLIPAKIKLGDKLFHDTRFSSTGKVSCATCHDKAKAFTDSPLKVSESINQLTGTRNAPTIVNSAYMHSMFWDDVKRILKVSPPGRLLIRLKWD